MSECGRRARRARRRGVWCGAAARTSSPSISERKPAALIADWWTKRSSPAAAGAMKPYPFSELNHLTAPICLPSDGETPSGHLRGCWRPPPRPRPPPPPLPPLTAPPSVDVTFTAFILPLSSIGSYPTFSPSCSVRKPSDLISVWCTNRSSPPSSGVMKPKPFDELNHLTVPVDMVMRYGYYG